MRLELLSPVQLDQLHRAALRLLDAVGVHVPHPEVRRLFREAGAIVEEPLEIVRIPESVIIRSVAAAGKTFTLHGRDASRQAWFGVGARNYNTSAGQASWVESSGRERRYAALADVRTAAQLGHALPGIQLVGAMADPHELPVEHRCVEVAATLFRHTTKPVFFFFHDRASARFVNELLTALAGSTAAASRQPQALAFLEPISPLRFPFHGLDLLFETSHLGLPTAIGPMAQTGATAPGTLAGTLAQEHAEVLAGLCVTQLIRPGLPVCYGGIPHAFDMRTTQIIFGGPEQALMAVAMTQLGKRLGLPVYVNVGLTDSKTPDAQAGIEAGITLLCGALAGADIFGHLGICGADQGASVPMLLMQHELIGYLERVLRGFEISDEHLGLDVIRSVGHGGNFLAEAHTARHFRQELWFPQLFDRQFWAAWAESGALDFAERARAAEARWRDTPPAPPLDEDLGREFDRIVAAARRELAPGGAPTLRQR